MSYRPLIAVVGYHLAPGRVTRWPEGGFGVPATYIEALRRAGARTLIVNPGEPNDAEEILEPFDGLLLIGGGDVDPSRYGADPDIEHNYGIEPDRDELEIALLHAADRTAMPTLCICRGMQVMNVAFGGTLYQHLPDMPELIEHGIPNVDTYSIHEVKPAPGSRLLATVGVDALTCSSHHHQGVDLLGDRITATGWSEDGLVEAIELAVDDPYAEAWMLGVQWHPEETASSDPGQQALFDGLALLGKVRGSRAKPGEGRGRTRDYGIVDYDPTWPSAFDEEAAMICAALGDLAERIEHVGSTSVVGLAAKPVIDIQLSVSSLKPRRTIIDPLVALGYQYSIDPIETEHEYLRKGYEPDHGRKVHLHVCETDSAWEQRHLAFRDALRADPAAVAAYAELKRELAARHPGDIFTYTDAKSDFIRSIEARASPTPGQNGLAPEGSSPG